MPLSYNEALIAIEKLSEGEPLPAGVSGKEVVEAIDGKRSSLNRENYGLRNTLKTLEDITGVPRDQLETAVRNALDLKSRQDTSQSELEAVRTELQQQKDAIFERERERDDFKQQVDTLTAERDNFKQQFESVDAQRQQYETENVNLKRENTISTVAAAAKVKPTVLAKLLRPEQSVEIDLQLKEAVIIEGVGDTLKREPLKEVAKRDWADFLPALYGTEGVNIPEGGSSGKGKDQQGDPVAAIAKHYNS